MDYCDSLLAFLKLPFLTYQAQAGMDPQTLRQVKRSVTFNSGNWSVHKMSVKHRQWFPNRLAKGMVNKQAVIQNKHKEHQDNAGTLVETIWQHEDGRTGV